MSTGFATLAGLLKSRSGLIVGPEKMYLLETRLAPIIRRENLRDLNELSTRLLPGSALERDVVEAMTTNESLFFRDIKPFRTLHAAVLPRLHAARPIGQPIRIWSAAASSGQEAYSIAMVAAELGPALGGRRLEILGTDIAREPLERARAGLYTQFEIQRGLPMQLLPRYFTKQNDRWCVRPALRHGVSFKEWNLLGDLQALGQFDVVFCRNVLIYFDQPTKKRVLEAIAQQMPADGALFLGGAETVLGLTERFRAGGESGVYVKV